MVSKAQVMAITAGDSWLAKGANILMFGPPGGGKSHLAAAIGLALIENGWRVLFTRTTDLVQKLQVARRELQLESAIDKLNKYDLLILDDLAYVTKDQAETSVLFELISARYEHRSILITANQPFGEWNRVFPDPAMTLAAVDRLVHHATIFEMNVESYRRRAALEEKRQRDRRVSSATIRTLAVPVARIASPELLPENGLLPHLNCSRRIGLGSYDEEGEHGNTCGIGCGDQLSLFVRRAGREGEDVRRVRGAHGLSSQACDAAAARRA